MSKRIEKQGKRETWEHAKSIGMDEFITLVSRHFPIDDVCVVSKGLITYSSKRPKRAVRVPAMEQTKR
ncbi:MAG: hypothetical protein ACRC3K_06615 [Plesiomonas sp.]